MVGRQGRLEGEASAIAALEGHLDQRSVKGLLDTAHLQGRFEGEQGVARPTHWGSEREEDGRLLGQARAVED